MANSSLVGTISDDLHHSCTTRALGCVGARRECRVDDRDIEIEIVSIDGSPLRRLVLDPTRDYQPRP